MPFLPEFAMFGVHVSQRCEESVGTEATLQPHPPGAPAAIQGLLQVLLAPVLSKLVQHLPAMLGRGSEPTQKHLTPKT